MSYNLLKKDSEEMQFNMIRLNLCHSGLLRPLASNNLSSDIKVAFSPLSDFYLFYCVFAWIH